jgi:hypothetical protein
LFKYITQTFIIYRGKGGLGRKKGELLITFKRNNIFNYVVRFAHNFNWIYYSRENFVLSLGALPPVFNSLRSLKSGPPYRLVSITLIRYAHGALIETKLCWPLLLWEGGFFNWVLRFLKRDFEKLRGYFDTNRFDLKRAPRQGPVGHPFPQYPLYNKILTSLQV